MAVFPIPEPAVGPPGQKVPIKLLDVEHEEFTRNRTLWENIGLLFRGGQDLADQITRFLIPRPQEPIDEYTYRCRRFVYLNVLSIIGYYGARIFKGLPQLVVSTQKADGTPGDPVTGPRGKFYQDFVVDCDRGQTPLHRFFNDVFLDALLYRRAWYCTDKVNLGDVTELNLQQYQDAGGDKPYFVHLPPSCVIDWSMTATRELEYVVARVPSVEKTFMGKSKRSENWYHFDRKTFTHYRAYAGDDGRIDANSEATLIATGPHALAAQNRVPFQRLEFPHGLWLGDRAYTPCVSHLNKTNELDFGIMMGCLIMPVYTSSSEVTPKIGESSIIKLGQGDTFGWSEPRGDVFKIAMENNRELAEAIYRAVYLAHQGRDSRTQPSVRSGVALQEDAKPSNEILEAFGGMLAQSIKAGMKDLADARGDDFQIELKGWDFVVEISDDRLNKIIKVLDLQLGSKTLEKELKIEVGLDAIPNASEAVRQEVIAQIKAAPTDEEKAAAAAADAQASQLEQLAAAAAAERATESDTDATP